jgi:hypothetical protein
VHAWWTVEPSSANSITFNSLLQVRNNITYKITYQIGSGEGIKVIGEPWHATWNNINIVPASDLSISDLWNHQGRTWKENELTMLFDGNGVDVIKNS